jgi:Rrf2 family iron-sulfur cluster assembly transcriptional regulator
MKLSTRSRYGTRMLLDLAQNFSGGPVQLGDIAKRQNISVKYLEQIIRPLKKANYVKSFRGSKGGHMLNKSPEKIAVGEIVALLEGGSGLTNCLKKPETCDRVDDCLTRHLWREASKTMFDKLNNITFADLLTLETKLRKKKSIDLP